MNQAISAGEFSGWARRNFRGDAALFVPSSAVPTLRSLQLSPNAFGVGLSAWLCGRRLSGAQFGSAVILLVSAFLVKRAQARQAGSHQGDCRQYPNEWLRPLNRYAAALFRRAASLIAASF